MLTATGTHATPLTDHQRADRYFRQNTRREFTARQQRRLRHKANRALRQLS